MGRTGDRIFYCLMKPILAMVCISASLAFIQAMVRLPMRLQAGTTVWAAIGLAAGLILFSLISPMMPLYVLGHEFTHWLIAKMFRRRTGRFRVGTDAGSVQIDNPNIWIVLGPYFLPIHAIIWIATWTLLSVWFHPSWFTAVLYAGIGFAYGFHCVLTVRVLQAGQSDLQHYGRFFSMLVIVTINLGVLFVALAVLSGTLTTAPACLLDAYVAQWNFIWKRL